MLRGRQRVIRVAVLHRGQPVARLPRPLPGRGRVGHDFFDRLHYDYYAFSPEVLRAMSHSKVLHHAVRDNFVNPLLAGLAVVTRYSSSGADALEVGLAIKVQVPIAWRNSGFAALETNGDGGDPFAWATKALASPHVSWALVEVIACGTRSARMQTNSTQRTRPPARSPPSSGRHRTSHSARYGRA